MQRFLLGSAIILVLALSLMAGEGYAAETSVRYTMTPAGDGALRLDTQTGEVSHCTQKSSGWACELAADDRSAYEREIMHLEKRLARLEASKNGGGSKNDLPTDEELDEAFGFFDSLMGRFLGFIKKWGPELEELDGENL